MRVVIAEKPQAGREMAAVLGIVNRQRGYIECKNDTFVTWAIGHLIRLRPAESYPEFEEWRLDTLPVIPNPMGYEVDSSGDSESEAEWSKLDQFTAIKTLVCDTRCREIVIASDAGREGEGIVRLILKQAWGRDSREGVTISRLWIDDLTHETIEKGFRNLLPGSEKEPLGWAAELRAQADFIIGMTASRMYTLHNQEVTNKKEVIPAGRVQTPTLHIVYKREMEIRNFTSKPFYEIHAKFQVPEGAYIAKWFRQIDENKTLTRFEDKAQAEAMLKRFTGRQGRVVSFEAKDVKKYAPHFLELTSLQTAARKQLGFGTEKTAKLAQKLYDLKLISYTRTESKHLTEEVADELVGKLARLQAGSAYASWFPQEIPSIRNVERFVNNEKAKEHHAIIVTHNQPSGLSDDEQKLYEIILQRTLAAFHPPGIDQEINIITEVDGERFYTRSIRIKEMGWRSVMKQAADEEGTDKEKEDRQAIQISGPLQPGAAAAVAGAKLHTGETTAPKRLAEDELIRAMENAGKIVDSDDEDDEGLALLRERGIGTKATRTHIIKSLKMSEYIDTKNNMVYLTQKGELFIEAIKADKLASVELTGEWEFKLKQVEDRRIDPEQIRADFFQYAQEIVQSGARYRQNVQALAAKGLYIENPDESVGECPQCQKSIVARKDFYGCSGFRDGCKFTLPKVFRKIKIPAKAVAVLVSGKSITAKVEGQYGAYAMILSLQRKADENGEIRYNLDLRKPDIQELSLGPCLKCKHPVVEKPKFYGCSNYVNGCDFTMPKTFLEKKLTASNVKAILEKGQSNTIKGFKSASKGTVFDAKLYFDRAENRLKLLFDEKKKASGGKRN